jgi:hypothetical protein
LSSAYNWPSPGCKGLWHFQDNGTDSSGEGNNGTASAGVAYALGKFGKCAYLTADYFTLAYVASLQVSNLTILAWYKGTDAAARSTLFGTSGIYVGGSSYTYYGYNFETRLGKVSLMLRGDSLTGVTQVDDNIGHLIAATRDNDFARVYVDGHLDAEQESPNTLAYCVHNPATYYWAGSSIGGSWQAKIAPSTMSYYPTCYLDELQLLDYALTPAQMRRLYAFQRGFL